MPPSIPNPRIGRGVSLRIPGDWGQIAPVGLSRPSISVPHHYPSFNVLFRRLPPCAAGQDENATVRVESELDIDGILLARRFAEIDGLFLLQTSAATCSLCQHIAIIETTLAVRRSLQGCPFYQQQNSSPS